MKDSIPQKRRETNYDVLRILCMLSVVLIHISAKYKAAITLDNNPYRVNMEISLLYNTMTRFAVPCFMMISGAFLISKDTNSNYSMFYKNNLKTIAIPTAFFSIIYFVISEIKAIKNGGVLVISPVIDLLKGNAYYHLWYMYVLIGVYFLIPVVIRVRQSISEIAFKWLSWVYLLVAILSYSTTQHYFAWSICRCICYLGFAMIGYQIRLKYSKKKNNIRGIAFICLGFLSLLPIYVIQIEHTKAGISEADEVFSLIGNFNPLVVLAAILIFTGFTLIDINRFSLNMIANHTFNIYLLHAGALEVYFALQNKIYGGLTDPIIAIPIGLFFTVIVSFVGSLIYCELKSRFCVSRIH